MGNLRQIAWKMKFVISLALLVFIPAITRADQIFNVSVNTAPLATTPLSNSGPYSLAFQFVDGSGSGDGNNTVTLSNFSFGGGSTFGSSAILGGVSGDLSSSLLLTDSDFFNLFQQGFTPGNALSFTLAITGNADSGGTPDEFAFSILQSDGSAIPTTDAGSTLFFVDLGSAPRIFAASGEFSAIGSPAIEVSSPVPEPGSMLLLITGLAGIAGRFIRQKHPPAKKLPET